MKLFNMLHLAFEDDIANQSKLNSEIEVAIYAHITNPEGLKQASQVIEQEQIESEFMNGVRCRVRKEVKNTETSYTFTYKVKKDGDKALQNNTECNIAIDQDFFEGFRNVAKKRLKKSRYVFHSKSVEMKLVKEDGSATVIVLPNLTYEVDVYKKKDGTESEWCKIDVELDTILPLINEKSEGKPVRVILKVSHLPFKPEKSMLGSSQVPAEKELMGKIWDNEWNLPPFDETAETQKVAQPTQTQPLPTQGS
jgi:hypothetical protein